MKKKLIIIRGPSGIGKSTITNSLCQQLRKETKRIAFVPVDLTLSDLLVSSYKMTRDERSDLIQENTESLVRNFLQRNYTVITEGMFYKNHKGAHTLERMIKLGKEYRAKVIIIELEADVEEIVRRVRKRAKENKNHDNNLSRTRERYEGFMRTRHRRAITLQVKGKTAKQVAKEIVERVQ